jgi:hypothetical protein
MMNMLTLRRDDVASNNKMHLRAVDFDTLDGIQVTQVRVKRLVLENLRIFKTRRNISAIWATLSLQERSWQHTVIYFSLR